jgi:predicted permease
LEPGRSLGEAEAEFRVLSGNPEPQRIEVTEARTLPQEMIASLRGLGALLLGFVSLILVVTAANLGNLVLGRGAARTREIGTRLALGASRWKVVRLLMAESLLLALGGGVVAILVGRVVSSGLGSIRIPVAGFGLLSGLDTSLDWRVALYTAAVSLATALLFGLAPAVESSRVALLPAMQEAASGSLRRARIRSAFIVVQFAASAALLVTGAVFVYHMIGLDLIDPGFETDGVFVVRDPTEPRLQNEDERRAVVEGLAARLAAQEGIQASLARDAPLNFSGLRLRIELEDGSELAASGTEVSEGHFDTLGIRLLGGRSFEASDRLGIPAVAVVNETLAERLWPGEPPLGRRFRQILPEDRPGPWVEVIGLATDSKYVDLLEDPTPFVYLPLPATGTRMPSILLRTELSEDQARALVQTELQALDPRLPVPQVRPVDALMDLSYFGFRVLSVLGSVMGTLALLLASIGTFGVVAYLATQRRLEIGICLTLGATQGRIVRRISGPMLLWSTVGIGVGSVLTAGVLRILPVMNGPIGETPFVVPIALVAATVLLTVCAFLAGTLPALQAVRNDPIQALRN